MGKFTKNGDVPSFFVCLPEGNIYIYTYPVFI